MSVPKFLSRRECGQTKNQRSVQELLEARAADPTINQSCQLLGQARSTFLMDFSADRRKIASTHGDHSVRVTDLATGKCTHVLTGHPRTPWCLAFHPSSSEILASGCLGGEVRIWDLHGGGSEVYRSPGDHVIASMAFHPSDHVLVFATSNELFFWDWCKPEPFTCCRTREDFERIRWIRFGPLGHCLYTGIANGSTIQRDDTTHISHISDPSSDSHYDSRQRMLRQRYRTLLTRFQAYQNDRSHGSENRNTSDINAGDPLYRAGAGANNSDEHDIISIGPRSPAHEDALDLAQEYAAHVTETTARLRNSRSYAATVTQDARRAMLFEQHGLNRPIPQGPELQARLRSARERASVAGDSSAVSAEVSAGGRGFRRGACSPPPRREIQPPPTTSQRIDQLLTSGSSDSRDAAFRIRDLSSIQRPLFINTTTDSSRTSYSPRDSSQVESVMGTWGNSTRRTLPSPLASVSGVNRTMCEHSPNSGTCPRGTGRLSSPGGASNSILRTRLNAAQDSCSLPSGSASHSSAQKSGPVVIFGREESGIWKPSASASTSQSSSSPSQGHDSITSAKNICSSPTDSRRPSHAVTSCSLVGSGNSVVTEAFCESGVTTVTASQTPCSTSTSSLSAVLSNDAATTCNIRDIFNSAAVTPSTTVYSTCVSCVHAPVASVSSVQAPAAISSVQAPVAISSVQANLGTVSHVRTPVAISSVQAPVAISSVQAPVAISSVQANLGTVSHVQTPVAISSVQAPVAISSVQAPVAISSVQAPVAISRVQPNLGTDSHVQTSIPPSTACDQAALVSSLPFRTCSRNTTAAPGQVPDGILGSSAGVVNTDSCGGSFRATGLQRSSGRTGSSPRSPPQSGLPPESSPRRVLESQTRPAPDLSLLGFRRIPSEALLATSVLPSVNIRPSEIMEEDVAESNPLYSADHSVTFDHDRQPPEHGRSAETAQGTVSASGSRISPRENANPDLQRTYATRLTYEPQVPVLSGSDASDEHVSISNMTSRLAQEINVLGRMIAMRERFSVRLQALQNERNEAMANSPVSQGSPPPGRIPEITITEHQVEPQVPVVSSTDQSDYPSSSPVPGPSRPNLEAPAPPESALQGLDRTWHTLQRRHLHPHYGVSILDETINRPNDALQAAINRAIAGAFMGTGEAAVASNIINLTHRIQCWDFSRCVIPDISQANTNIVVPHCKIHNDASCDISQDGTFLATFVPSHRGFPDDTILAVFSLLPGSRGDCLFTKSFGPNAISVSLSPLKTHLVVGLASRRLSWVFTTSQVVGQVYKLRQPKAGEASMEAVTDIHHPCDMEIQSHISVNSVRWLPGVGEGVIYGTNRGDLHICRPG
ncbi:activating molecule in BECN1-regulated autophagy protein 1-like [Liolophura sinensis]|uniref:activating molecule in BECN1-regulated autophagy protein 1-like n=1 Tax=Liolophura sinensis TaxID=3198878 RepID=UPI0031596D50